VFRLLLSLTAIAIAALVLVLLRRAPPATPAVAVAVDAAPRAFADPPVIRPTRPPGPEAKKPPRPPEPALPRPGEDWKAELRQRVAASPNPGEVAFRAYSDLYVDQNLGFAEKQAAAEGLTVGEVRDLTHFGLLVLASQRVPEIEELLGRELTAEERDALADLMVGTNDQFKQEMRALVARGASEAERRKLIADTDAAYRKGYFAATGMTPELLDDLLAGDLLLPGAPGATEPPAGAPVEDGKDDEVAPVRPAR
jgi:hypothetical protein